MRSWSGRASSSRFRGKGSFVAPQNIELIREEKLRQAEERVREAVDIARSSGITLEELKIILEELYTGEV